MKRSQFLIALGTSIAAILFGLTLTTAPSVQAATDLGNYKPITQGKITYVKVKRPIFTGQYSKVDGKKNHSIMTKVGTVLAIENVNSSHSAVLTLGTISYAKSKHIYQSNYVTKKFNTTYFKPWKLKLPIRTMPFQQGTHYSPFGPTSYQPMFVITMDGFLQYYSSPRLKHYKILSSNQAASTYRLNQIKPTKTQKVATYKVRHNRYYIYFKHPFAALNTKKVSTHYYRVTIKKTSGNIQSHWSNGGDFVNSTWIRYSVNNKPYFSITYYEAGD